MQWLGGFLQYQNRTAAQLDSSLRSGLCQSGCGHAASQGERHLLGLCQHQLCWLELRSAQEQDIIFLFSPLKIGVVHKDPITGHAQTLQ